MTPKSLQRLPLRLLAFSLGILLIVSFGTQQDVHVAAAAVAAQIQASLDDNVPGNPAQLNLINDADSDGNADPGDTLRYTAVLTNTGSADAANVQLADTLPPGAVLVPNSIQVSPVAFDDTASVQQGTTQLIPVLNNDTNVDESPGWESSATITIVTPPAHGNAIQSGAQVQYQHTDPDPSNTTDSFTYTVTDVEGLTSSPATVSITIQDSAPGVTTTTPTEGTTGIGTDDPVTINFSEPVTVSAASFALECPVGTSRTFTLATVTSSSYQLTPTAPLPPANTACRLTVLAAQVSDQDTNDPPDHMAADFILNYTTDAAPTVTSTIPTGGAINVGSGDPITVNFSEPVSVSAASFTLECPVGTARTFTFATITSGSYTLTPTAPLPPANTACQVTVLAAQVSDVDANDPPDNLDGNGDGTTGDNYVFTYTTDAAPSVTSTTPLNGATSIGTDAPMTVNFSENVNVTANTFTLACPVASPQAFSLAPAAPGGTNSFTLTPTGNLPENTLCTVTVVAAEVSDTDANDPPDQMAANYVFSFSTDQAPAVTSTTPDASNDSGNPWAIVNPITVTFSESVDVTASAFTLTCLPSFTPAFTISPAPPGGTTSFVLTPTSPLPPLTTCTLTVVAAQVTDTDAGDPPNTMNADDVVTFSTGPSDTAPSVTNTTPTDGATGIGTDDPITINFSEPVTVSAASFTLECPVGTGRTFTLATVTSSSYQLTPTAPLAPANTPCQVTVLATGVSDVDTIDPPDNLAANYVFAYTTDAAPSVTSTTPLEGATNLGTDDPITITFSEPVTVSAASFTLECPVGTARTFTLATLTSSSYQLTPTAPLPPSNSACRLTVLAAQVSDVDTGDPPDTMTADFVLNYSTDAAPTISSTTPTNGATGIGTDDPITINFSEPVTVSAASFTLECPVGTARTFTFATLTSSSYTLTPTAPLPPANTACQVTVLAAQVSDVDTNDPPDQLDGNGDGVTGDNYVFTYTTDAAPSVTTTVPSTGATGIGTDDPITITFSEPVTVSAASFTLECPLGTGRTFTLATVTSSSYTLTPTAPLPPANTACQVTVLAAQVSDVDTNDPPDQMAANFVLNYTTDAAPAVLTTTPTNGAINVAASTNITITFSESVNATTSSFTIECPTGSAQPYALSASPNASFTLNPTSDLPSGVTCTVTVVAAQISDVDTGDPPDNMAADDVFSFTVPPHAVNDNVATASGQSVVGNVGFNSANIPYSVTSNDVSVTAFTISAFDAISVNGGTVSLTTSGANMGQFTYNPPRGFEGSDTFTYTISNAAGSSTATVTISVSGMIWFINNTVAACSSNCGRLSDPYNSLAAFNTANGLSGGLDPDSNDNVFVYESATGYSGAVTLRTGQKLIGQDATATLASIAGVSPGSASATLPAMDTSAPTTNITSTVTLNTNATVRGLSINATTSTGMNDPAGAITGVSVSEVSVTTTTGTAVSLSSAGGTFSFTSISANGGANGILLNTTTGSFTVTGNGGVCTTGTPTCTGGSIQNSSAEGILATSASNLSFSLMKIQNNVTNASVTNSAGVSLTDTTGAVTFADDLVTGNGNANGAHNLQILSSNSGSTAITTLTFTNGSYSNSPTGMGILVHLKNSASIATGSFTNVTFSGNASMSLNLVGDDNSVIGNSVGSVPTGTVTISGSTFTNSGGLGVSFASGGGSGSPSMYVRFVSNTLTGTKSHAINVVSGASSTGGTQKVLIDSNHIGTNGVPTSGSQIGEGIVVTQQGRETQTVTITNNVIRALDNAASGPAGFDARGIDVQMLGPTATGLAATPGDYTIVGNDVDQQFTGTATFIQYAIYVGADDQGSPTTLHAAIHGNTVPTTNPCDTRCGAPQGMIEFEQVTAPSTGTLYNFSGSGANVSSEIANTNTGTAGQTTSPNTGLSLTGTAPNVVAFNVAPDGTDMVALVGDASSQAATHQLAAYAALKPAIVPVMLKHPVGSPAASLGSFPVSIGTLPVGKSVTIIYDVVIANPFPAGADQIGNQGTVTYDDGITTGVTTLTDDPNVVGLSDPTVTPIDAQIALTLAKSDGGASVVPGNSVTYTLTYGNSGNQSASGVALTETVPANTTVDANSVTAGWVCAPDTNPGATCTFAIGGLAGGSSGLTQDFILDLPASVSDTVTQISNDASIDDDGTSGESGFATASDTTPVTAAPVLSGQKTVADDNGGLLLPGDTLTYTVVINNTGNRDAANAAFSDPIPADTTYVANSVTLNSTAQTDAADADATTVTGTAIQVTLGALPALTGTATITFQVTVATPYPASDSLTISNQGTVSASNAPSALTDDPALPGTSDPTAIDVIAGLTIQKAFLNTALQVNQTTTLRFTLINPNGSPALTNLSFTDDLPAGLNYVAPAIPSQCAGTVTLVDADSLSFSGGQLAAGVSQCTIDVAVTATGSATGVLVNQSSAVTSGEAVNSRSGARATIQVAAPGSGGGGGSTTPAIPAENFLCLNLATQTNGAMTGQGGFGNVGLSSPFGNSYCHVLNLDGQYLPDTVTGSAQLGDPTLIQLGVVQAIDVFGLLPGGFSATHFSSPVGICLRGSGSVYFISSVDHSVQLLPAVQDGGYLCVTVSEAGKVVLVGTPNPTAPLPPDTGLPSGAPVPVSQCQVTTTNAPLNLRAEPNTSSQVLAQLPYNAILTATEYQPGAPGWYRVIYLDMQGWVREDFLNTLGTCPS